jgi:signal transduction histidine kinase
MGALVGAVALLVVGVQITTSPALHAFVVAHLPRLFVAAGCGIALLALVALRHGAVHKELSRVAELLGNLDTRSGTPPKSLDLAPELGTLTEPLQAFMGRWETHREESVTLRATNRVLARQLRRVFRLLDSVQVGVLLVDTRDEIVFANEQCAPYLLLPPADAQGTRAQDSLAQSEVSGLVGDHTADEHGADMQQVELAGDATTSRPPVRVTRYRGEVDGTPIGQVLAIQDTTRERETVREEAAFVRRASQELHEPLAIIQRTLKTFSESEDANGHYSELSAIYEASERLSKLVDNLVNSSLLDTGEAHLELNPAPLKELLENGLDLVRTRCGLKNATLQVDLPERLPTVRVDHKFFGAAVSNLLENAAEHAVEGDAIRLSTVSHEDELHVTIRESGRGVAPEDLAHMFDMAHTSAAVDDGRAATIGLATAHQILHLHGGDIRVDCKEGAGLQYSIVLPRELVDGVAPEEAAQTPSVNQGLSS